jgi:hypothetical protein
MLFEQVRTFDNRPKALAVTDLHPDIRFEGLLRSHFQSFGQVTDISFAPDDASACVVTFATRREAEVAMQATLLNGKTLKICWHVPVPKATVPAESGDSAVPLASVADASEDALTISATDLEGDNADAGSQGGAPAGSTLSQTQAAGQEETT